MTENIFTGRPDFIQINPYSGGSTYLFPESSSNEQVVPDPYYYDSGAEALMRQRGIISGDETLADSLTRVTNSLLDFDATMEGTLDLAFSKKVKSFVECGVIVYGTPVLANAGRNNITAACTVLPLRVRSGQADFEHFSDTSYLALSKAVGTGYDLSELNEPSQDLHMLNSYLDTINTRLIADKKRPVASMATLRDDHPDILNFIAAKKDVDFADWRFNISIFVTDALMAAHQYKKDWALRDNNGQVVRHISADDLLGQIAKSAHYCGEPGVLFKNRIDEDNPTPQWEYKSTAPCAEVAMSEGEACQFSYINLGGLLNHEGAFDKQTFGEAVETLVRVLDASVEMTVKYTDEFPLVREKRRIGIGITGFADLLIGLRIPYDTSEAAHLAAEISELLDYHSKTASMRLSRERGPFPAFDKSRYTDSSWIRRKLTKTTGVVSGEDWEKLFNDIDRYGIRHASTTSLPPTGTSSTIVGSSKSLEPIFTLSERGRMIKSVEKLVQMGPKNMRDALGSIGISGMLSDEQLLRFPFLRTARQLSPRSHMAVQEGFQSFLDESSAKTVNLPNTATVNDVLGVIVTAHSQGLKGITVFRDDCLQDRSIGSS